jgi:maleylpyruvate isomerase
VNADALVLHGYWRSSASYRVRIALNLKGLPYRQAPVNLLAGEQRGEEYRALNPQGYVPTLVVRGRRRLTQSLAILEWLEEAHPLPALLPEGADERAVVRGMVGVMGLDVHPLANLKVLQRLRGQFGADDEQVNAWARHWIGEGLAALEPMVAEHGGAFAYKDLPTMADCLLAPLMYSARRFGADLGTCPSVVRVAAAATELTAFIEAHPDRQPDAPRTLA